MKATCARRQYATSLLGIEYLLDRKVLHLSGGEAQKLMLARALMKAPRLLILLDPYSGLDADSRKTFGQCLDALMAEATGPALVFATPRPEEIPARITHLAIVSGGRLVRKMQKPEDITAAGLHSRKHGTPKSSAPTAFPEPLRRGTFEPGRPSAPTLFSVTNATVRYKDTVILKDVNWTVRAGENWALVGPNGAGKTTLLSLVLGDNPHCYANDVRVMGRRRGTGETIWDIKSRIGYLSPELHACYPKETSCKDVVLSGFSDSIGCYRSYSDLQQKHAAAWLESLGVANRADNPLGSADLAEQRRVLLARALVKDPPLLLLDEPCQSLAARATSSGCWRKIRTSKKFCLTNPGKSHYWNHKPLVSERFQPIPDNLDATQANVFEYRSISQSKLVVADLHSRVCLRTGLKKP